MRGTSVQTAVVPGPRRPPEENGEGAAPSAGDLTGDLTAALHAAQHGDEAGFVAVYRDVQPRLLRYATLLVGRNNAEDVTAEAWLQISRDLHASPATSTGSAAGRRRSCTTARWTSAGPPPAARPPRHRDDASGRARRGFGHRGVRARRAVHRPGAHGDRRSSPGAGTGGPAAGRRRAGCAHRGRGAGQTRRRGPRQRPPGAQAAGPAGSVQPRGRPVDPCLTPDTDVAVTGIAGPALRVTRCTPDDSAGCPAPPPSDCSTAATVRPRSPSSSPQRRPPPPQQSCGASPPPGRLSGRRCIPPRSPTTSPGDPRARHDVDHDRQGHRRHRPHGRHRRRHRARHDRHAGRPARPHHERVDRRR